MTKEEYLEKLKNYIQPLPIIEQESALNYYKEYFEEAGKENEKKVMEELGDPEELANFILSKFPCVPVKIPKSNNITEDKKEKNNKAGNLLLLLILIIFTFPIWTSAFFSILGILMAIIIFAFVFSGLGAIIGVILMPISISIFIAGLINFSFTIGSLFTTGLALIIGGLGLLLTIYGCNYFAKIIPTIVNTISKFLKFILSKIQLLRKRG